MSPVYGSGSVTTIGDKLLKTGQLRLQTNSGGENIPVGVISNGVDGLNNSRDSGDLPQDIYVIRPGKRSEGTAMLEIIHDIAPGSPLLFCDFGGGKEEEFVNAVDNLIKAGAKIIVDDVGFLQVPYFEDGTIGSRLLELLSENPEIILISAAGNNADAHYQGLFSDDGGGYHSFNGKTGIPVEIYPGATMAVFLEWDDPFGASANDYNLYLFEGETLIGMSERPQTGNQNPIEKLTHVNTGKKSVKAEIRILKAVESAQPKTLEVFINADKDKVIIPEEYLIPEDSIIGQSAIPGVISVAAISSTNVPVISKFSSNGYVTIRSEAERRKKPDITGISDVEVTGAGGFPKTFAGTSAAAPHIAGLLALVWSLFPDLPSTDLKNTLYSTALELGDPGWDPVFGFGLPDAIKMYEQILENSSSGVTGLTESPVIGFNKPEITQVQADPWVITGSVSLTKPGIYTLGDDIYDYSGMIISIASSDVTIIGNGHSIEGASVQFVDDAPVEQAGIIMRAPDNSRLKNVVLKDMTITGTTGGILGTGVDNLLVSGCKLPYNTNGIELKDAKDGTITDCEISGNSNTAIIVSDGSDNMSITHNSIKNNLFSINTEGSTNTHISDNDISDNWRDNELPGLGKPSEDIVPVPAAAVIPAGKGPCKDANYDSVCDDTEKKTPVTSSRPVTYTQTIEVSRITPVYEEPAQQVPYVEPAQEPAPAPQPCPTCPETGEPQC